MSQAAAAVANARAVAAANHRMTVGSLPSEAISRYSAQQPTSSASALPTYSIQVLTRCLLTMPPYRSPAELLYGAKLRIDDAQQHPWEGTLSRFMPRARSTRRSASSRLHRSYRVVHRELTRDQPYGMRPPQGRARRPANIRRETQAERRRCGTSHSADANISFDR